MWFRRPAPRTRPTPGPALGLTALETREVPAAYSFTSGLLTVNMAEVPRHSFSLGANSAGVLTINARATGGAQTSVAGAPDGRLMAAQVKAVRVNGSAFDDVIDLSAVDTRAFRNLSGRVAVTGGAGRDTIRGTQFNDTIDAGAGNDRVFGGLGHDRIDGGAGNDRLYGGGGGDVLIGGAGADTFWDTGRVGWDVFWVDGHDRTPSHGWGWAGAEQVRTGTPR